MIEKLKFFANSLSRYNEKTICPSCGSEKATLVDTKYLVLKLYACQSCFLQYRHPTEKEDENEKFYQSDYIEKGDNLTTYMPSESELSELKNKSFNSGSDRSFDRLVKIFQFCFPEIKNLRVVDYGSSWGYLSYQMKEYGINVQSYEISEPRANYGNENLGLNIVSDVKKLELENDIFFSSHVIEHVPSVKKMIEIGKSLIKENGVFISICPNGSPEFRERKPKNFHTAWGQVHPNYLTAAYFKNCFKNNPYYIGSSPFNTSKINGWENKQTVDELGGDELLVISKPDINL